MTTLDDDLNNAWSRITELEQERDALRAELQGMSDEADRWAVEAGNFHRERDALKAEVERLRDRQTAEDWTHVKDREWGRGV